MAFSIALPDAASLPTTTVKLINALQGIVVTLHPSADLTDSGHGDVDVEIMHAVDRDGRIVVYGHPWDETSSSAVIHLPLDLIGSITVH